MSVFSPLTLTLGKSLHLSEPQWSSGARGADKDHLAILLWSHNIEQRHRVQGLAQPGGLRNVGPLSGFPELWGSPWGGTVGTCPACPGDRGILGMPAPCPQHSLLRRRKRRAETVATGSRRRRGMVWTKWPRLLQKAGRTKCIIVTLFSPSHLILGWFDSRRLMGNGLVSIFCC